MVYRMVPFRMIFSDPQPTYLHLKVTEYIGLDTLDVLCAQLTHDLFTIAKFLFCLCPIRIFLGSLFVSVFALCF